MMKKMILSAFTLLLALSGDDKEVYTIPGYSHIDLYDKPGAVNPAVEKLAGFFTRTLAE